MFVNEGDKEQENESNRMTQNAQRQEVKQRQSRKQNAECLIVGLNE